MVSRFERLLVSDSDEDSTDNAVIERREERSNGVGSARATPPPVGTPTQPTPAVPPTKVAESGLASAHKGTPRNDSVASSKPIALGSGSRSIPQAAPPQVGSTEAASVDFNVDPTPHRGAAAATTTTAAAVPVPRSASQHSFTLDLVSSGAAPSESGGSALAVLVPRRVDGGSARHALETAPQLAVSAPYEDTSSSIKFAPDDRSQRTGSRHPGVASAAQGTPHESGAASVGSDGQKKKTKVVRRKVVMRRRKDADPNDPGEVLRVDEEVIRPSRPQNASSAINTQAHMPPPPSRVSPRAMHAAASRSASRAHTPAEDWRTPRGGPREAPPQIPTTRADSRAATPRAPRAGHVDDVPPLLARSQHTDANAGRPLISPRSNRNSRRQATPRTPAESTSHADSPIAFEVVPDTATSNTVNFQVEDPNARTDDTISFKFEETATPQRTASRGGPNYPHRHPQIPSPSALDDGPTPTTTDENGQKVMLHRAKVRLTETADGRQAWMLFSPRTGEGTAAPLQEIPAPPKRLSQRAQDILAAKRHAVEADAKRRHAEAVKRAAAPESAKSPVFFEVDEGTEKSAADDATESELHFESAPLSESKHVSEQRKRPQASTTRSTKRLSIARRARVHFAFAPSAFYSEAVAQQHVREAQAANEAVWTRHTYDTMPSCAGVVRASGAPGSLYDAEKVVRALLPVQVAPTEGSTGTCGCVVYDKTHDDALRQLINNNSVREEGVRRYLNLQPMQLANVELQNMVDPPLESPAELPNVLDANPRVMGEQRGVATLGGLWCIAEALRGDGRPATRKDSVAPRRIMRICGGQALGVPLQPESGATLDVRCYELLLFPRESLSPSAVNYGSEGLTLGQLIAPPASSFPLTPRIVDDPVTLKEYKKRLLSTKNRQIAIVNNEDDRDTFSGTATDPGKSGQYLTLTMVTISSRQKYTIELTLVLLPFRSSGIYGGKTVAEVPRFCPTTVMTYRRLQGLALSFSTKSAFMSAYKALLWATECDIVDVQPGEGEDATSVGLGYSKLRVCATSSPMVPWVASFGRTAPEQKREETYHGNCLDFAVLALAAPPEAIQKTEPEPRDPLTLEDFIIADADGDGDEVDHDGARSEQSGATGRQQRRSSIFTSTLAPTKKADADDDESAAVTNTDTVVGLTAYGAIRRAVSQKTSEVFDVRVMPRNRGRMAPTWDAAADTEWNVAGGQTVKAKQEHLLQQDVEAAIMMEYTSRLPFHSRVYGVLVDEQRYYIFQEPWISALALEQSVSGSAERDAIEYNTKLKSMTQSTAVMSLKDFIHAILRPDDGARGMKEEVKLQLAHVLAAQLLLLITSLHGKAMLLGPCPPQRVLVRIENANKEDEEPESVVDTPDKTKQQKAAQPKVQSSHIQLFVPDLGVSTLAWGYERQQCGVLEYLPPMYVLEQMLCESIGREERAWTMHDDWWTYLTLCFELFASDGSALVTPKKSPPVPTPTPTLTKFFSPVDILDVWQEVVADSSAGVAGTAADTVSMRVRHYVHQRVLKSVSRSLDSWISTKLEEVEYFGTTAARRGRRVVRAVPPRQSSSPGRTIGVSLAAAYLQSARDATSETSSITFQTEDGEEGEAENVLEDMPWVFQVRDFFDAVLDAVFTPSSCAVHGPALRLVSHPFFRTVSLPHIFDGTHVFSPAVSHFALRQLTKPKVQTALLTYRTCAYRGPMAVRPEMPLMITESAYNAAGKAGSGAPLLMLSSPAYQDEQTTRENDNFDSRGGAAEMDPTEGLVFSRTNSMSQGLNGMASPRSQSPAAAPWSQQKLRAMYNPTEWQSIAALETEVRGALNSFGPRESVSSRRASADKDFASHPVTISNRPAPSAHHDYNHRHGDAAATDRAETASVTSSARRRDPREYEHVVDATPDVRQARGAAARRPRHQQPRDNVVSAVPHADDAYDTFAAGAPAEDARAFEQPQQQETYNSHPTYWRDGRDGRQASSFDKKSDRDAMQRSQHDSEQPRRARRYGDTRDMEQNLNDLAARHAETRQNNEPRRHQRKASGGTNSGYGTGYPEPLQQQLQYQPQGSHPRPQHSSRHQAASRHYAWPDQFLNTATLQKKGQPQRLADPQSVAADRLTIDIQTQRSLRSVGSNSHHGGSIVHAAENVRIFHESSSEESYVLVASDDELSTDHGHGSAHPSRGMNRESPVPRNPRGLYTGEVASARENYFEF
jgi:hypothetical protein